MQYSADLQGWTDSLFPLTAAGNTVQWTDDGPPRTPAAAPGTARRYYRVVRQE